VLERVIKARYETLSKNFTETSATLEKLALESVKEKKEKKRIIKDNHRLWRLAKHLKKKIKKVEGQNSYTPRFACSCRGCSKFASGTVQIIKEKTHF
jgi:hypothetical protein